MRRAAIAVVLLLLLGIAHPVGQVLRAQAPSTGQSHRLGTGRMLGSVLTGPFRPLLRTYVWIRADILYGQGRMDEWFQLMRFMIQLYPNNQRAHGYLGWMLAFNAKSEAPPGREVEVGWLWSEQGLDILVQSEEGRSWVADWIRKQCGQNSVYRQRYAGPAWEEEKQWRARLRAWGRRQFGEELGRFELGLLVLRGREGLYDRARKTQLLDRLAFEELLRRGESRHAPDAVAALREMAKEFADDPTGELGPYFRRRAELLETLASGQAPQRLAEEDLYPAAMALWGLGVRRRDDALLAAAQALLQGTGEEVAEESEAIGRWRRHLRDPQATAPPPLPFQGMP